MVTFTNLFSYFFHAYLTMENNEVHLEQNEIFTRVKLKNSDHTVEKNIMVRQCEIRSIDIKGIHSASRIPSSFLNTLNNYKHILSDFSGVLSTY